MRPPILSRSRQRQLPVQALVQPTRSMTSTSPNGRSGSESIARSSVTGAASSQAQSSCVSSVSDDDSRENPTLSTRRQNQWNLFQHQVRNRGLNSRQLSVLHKDFKKSNDR